MPPVWDWCGSNTRDSFTSPDSRGSGPSLPSCGPRSMAAMPPQPFGGHRRRRLPQTPWRGRSLPCAHRSPAGLRLGPRPGPRAVPPETGVRSRRLLGPTARPREFQGAVASSTAFLSPAAWPSHGPQERRRQPAGESRQRLHAVGAVRRGTRHRSPWRQAASSVRARRTPRGPRHSRRHHVRR